MKVLGIETSCDETAVAVYDGREGLLANRVWSQVELHRPHGRLDVSLSSQKNHGRAFAAQPLEHDEPARIGKMEIEEYDVGAHPLERLHRLLARALAPHLVREALEIIADRAQHARVVVNQEQRVSHDAP